MDIRKYLLCDCWKCPKCIVEIASDYLPHISAIKREICGFRSNHCNCYGAMQYTCT